MAELTPSELTAYKSWVHTPLTLPAASLAVLPIPPPSFQKQRQEVYAAFVKLEHSITTESIVEIAPGICLDKWDNLSGEENARLITGFEEMLAPATALTESPFYSYLPRGSKPDQYYEQWETQGHDAFSRVLRAYVKLQAVEGKTTQALDALELHLKLLSRDPHAPIMWAKAHAWDVDWAITRSLDILERIQTVAELQRLLNMLNRAYPRMFQDNITAMYLGEAIAEALRMRADGFTSTLNLTPHRLLSMKSHESWQYQKWLRQNIRADDPRVQAGIIIPDHDGLPVFKKNYSLVFINSIFQLVLVGLDPPHLPRAWKSLEAETEDYRRILEEYNLRRQELARRIAAAKAPPSKPRPSSSRQDSASSPALSARHQNFPAEMP